MGEEQQEGEKRAQAKEWGGFMGTQGSSSKNVDDVRVT